MEKKDVEETIEIKKSTLKELKKCMSEYCGLFIMKTAPDKNLYQFTLDTLDKLPKGL